MENFLKVLLVKDNEVIALCGIIVIFFTIVAFVRAIKNDRLKRKSTAAKDTKEEQANDKIQVWPYLVRKEFIVCIWLTIGLLVWGCITDAPLEEFANPNVTPNPSKAPWYFLGLQEMLVYFDPWIAGVILPSLIIVGLMAIPYVDINPKGNGYYTFRERIFAITVFCFGFLVLWIMLIVVGVFLRGPGWLIFMPWQEWDSHRIVAETNYDFTQFFGIDSKSLLGFFIGGWVVALYYVLGMGIPYVVMRKGKTMAKLGIVRYALVAFLFWTMLALPIKILLRLMMNLKYVWVTPWFNI
ncbi:MAG: cytochrome C [Candidatus Brocadia sp.]|nr:cytochrome C [Candidatus Brocadia sp.]